MHPNAALLDRFYTAFAARDGDAMAACYAPDATFSDPVFPKLTGPEAGAMWKMLIRAGKDLRLAHRDVVADDATGSAHWEAWYTFATGRKVHNVIEARFRFRDGLIVAHTDDFDAHRWGRQALGPIVAVPGLGALAQWMVRRGANKQLAAWIRKRGAV